MSKHILAHALPKLWDDLSLRPYLGEIRRRHGIVESLALPSMRDLPPLRIETLFVSPLLAKKPVSADSDPKHWPEGKSLLETLQEHPQLVVLGDPGGGKTTLSNWLAWRLSAGLTTPLPPVLEERVPLPCVLREMSPSVFTPGITLPELAVSIAERLLSDKADDALKASLRARVEAGSYVLILDGVDEIPIPHRKIVADWMQEAHLQNACVLATSRIVGYEDCPMDRSIPDLLNPSGNLRACVAHSMFLDLNRNKEIEPVSEWLAKIPAPAVNIRHTWDKIIDPRVQYESFHFPNLKIAKKWVDFKVSLIWAQLRYLMPFDQSRIAAFAENWYRQRCGTEHEARQKASDLLASLAQSDVTRQLARTPNLLSLMAIVHRERAHLPDGKALLYDEIANAYINTIDKQRKIESGDALAPYNWKERKAWLAYVGFQMQQLRGNQKESNKKTDVGVLASEKDVLKWLSHAMQASGVNQPDQSAQIFLSWVARRSGLLLPRGNKRYAFVHLSFQEYFCACYLDTRIASRAFIHDKLSDDDPVTKPKLAAWSKLSVWRETLVYLFELQSAERDADWLDDLAEILFKSEENDTQLNDAQAALAGRVLADRHIRLREEWKDRLADRCCQQANHDWRLRKHEIEIAVLPALLAAGYAAIVAAPTSESDEAPHPLLPVRGLASLEEIKSETRLRICIVVNKNISDVTPLAKLNNLQILDLSGTRVADVSPLAELNNLRWLKLSNTRVTDVAPLAGLNNLQQLELSDTRVANVSPLAGLNSLRWFILNRTRVADASPLAGLNNLRRLNLSGTRVNDVTPLAGLNNLVELDLSNTQVTDITPLIGLKNLDELNLSDTKVTDITPLTGLNKLWVLELNNTQVADVTPLAGHSNLWMLFLNSTQVVDVTPLAELKELCLLELSDTKVTDITPLSGLKQLQITGIQPAVKKQVMPRKKRNSTKKMKA